MTEHHRTFGCSGITDGDAARIERGVRDAERAVARGILSGIVRECIDAAETGGEAMAETHTYGCSVTGGDRDRINRGVAKIIERIVRECHDPAQSIDDDPDRVFGCSVSPEQREIIIGRVRRMLAMIVGDVSERVREANGIPTRRAPITRESDGSDGPKG